MQNLLHMLLYVLLFVFPALVPILGTYLITDVFRYKVRHKKRAFMFATLSGILSSIMTFMMNRAVDNVLITVTFIYVGCFFFLVFYLIADINDKVWRRVLVVILTFDIISDFGELFDMMKEALYQMCPWEHSLRSGFLYLLINIVMASLEILMLYAIAKMREKKDDTPLPLPMVFMLFVVLNIISGLLPKEYGGIENDANILTSVITGATGQDLKDNPFIVLSMTLVLLYVFFMFYIRAVRKETHDLKELNKRNEEYIEMQTKYFELSAKSDDTIRSMRHDMRNNTQVLMLLLEAGEYDKMREYLEQMGNDLVSADISAHTGNTIADAIIADKTLKAEKCGCELKVSGQIAGIEFASVDICKILANILDNAIEAAGDERLIDLSSEFKVIKLDFKKTDKFFLISLTNPCASKPEIVDGQIETHKSDKSNHGLGLNNVRTAAAVYGGEVSLECEDRPYGGEFRTEILFILPS